MICFWCDEPIPPEEAEPLSNLPFHHECGFRSVAGSVAHIEARCSCFIRGSEEGDPPGLTKRQAAQAALEAFQRLERIRAGLSIHVMGKN